MNSLAGTTPTAQAPDLQQRFVKKKVGSRGGSVRQAAMLDEQVICMTPSYPTQLAPLENMYNLQFCKGNAGSGYTTTKNTVSSNLQDSP